MDLQPYDPAQDFLPIIDREAADQGVPVPLARALFHQESGFNPNAVNSQTGATGLGQLMPDTAGDIDRTDPAANIQRAMEYLREGYDREGTTRGALQYYYGGPNQDHWGEKTAAYPDQVLRHVAEDQRDNLQWGGKPPTMDLQPYDPSKDAPPEMQLQPYDPAQDKAQAKQAATDNPDFSDLPSLADAAKEVMKWPTKIVAEGASFFGGAAPMAAGYAAYALNRALGADPDQAIKAALQARQDTDPGAGLAKLAEVAGVDKSWIQSDAAQGFMQEMNEKWIQPASEKYFPAQESLPKTLFEDLANIATFGAVGGGLHAAKGAAARVMGAEAPAAEAAPEPTPANAAPAEPAAAAAPEAGTFTDQNAPARADLATPPPVAPAADPMQEAVQRAVDLTNETGVQHRARQVDGAWTAVPDQGAAPAADVLNAGSVDEAIAAAQRATEPLEKPAEATETPETQPVEATPVEVPPEALAAPREAPQVAPETAAAPEVAAPAEVPAERGVADMSPHEIDLALRLTRSEDRRAELQSELDRRSTETPNDQAPNPAEDVARNDAQPGAPVDAGSHDELAPAAGAEGGPGPVDANNQGAHQLADGVADATQRLADAEQAPSAAAPDVVPPSLQDFTTPKGEVRTFASAKLAQAFAKTKAQGFTPRQVEGQWVLSRTEVVRTDAQKANDSRLSRQARVVQPEDDLETLLRKNGGINASELTRDGADPKDVAASLRFGAARKTGGMSLDGAAEVMASHGYDVHDEHGAIDATKARDLIQRVLDGERIFTPEGMEIRQQRAEANRQAGFEQDDEILRQADLPKEDGVEAGMVARASEIDESAVERLAIQYEGDDAGFVRAIREFLDDPNHETAARGEAAPAEEARASEAAPDREGALARLKSAGEAVRNAKLGEAAGLMPELEAARRNAEQAGITPIEAVQALQAPRRILTPEERLRLLPKEEEPAAAAPPKPEPPEAPKETPAPSGVSLSEPRIEDAPPALLRRVTVPIDRFHEGEGVKTEQVAAHEALAEHDAEISAFEKLLECVRA